MNSLPGHPNGPALPFEENLVILQLPPLPRPAKHANLISQGLQGLLSWKPPFSL